MADDADLTIDVFFLIAMLRYPTCTGDVLNALYFETMDLITHHDLRTDTLAWDGVGFDWELERLQSAVAFIS